MGVGMGDGVGGGNGWISSSWMRALCLSGHGLILSRGLEGSGVFMPAPCGLCITVACARQNNGGPKTLTLMPGTCENVTLHD